MLVVVTVSVCLMLWWYITRRGVSKSNQGTTAETETSDYETMRESAAYQTVRPDGRNPDPDIRMRESNAYGAGVGRQPSNNLPMYETVTEGHHEETQ